MKKIINVITSVLVLGFILALSVFAWVKPADDISNSERRELAKFPELSFNTLISGSFMKNFENYTLDQFPLRELFRSIKAQSELGVFNKKSNNDIIEKDGYITKIEPETLEVTIRFDDCKVCRYARTDLHQITLAYAITIHKSQGSEFDCVVIPLVPGAPIIVTRNLLYTAITRAKKAVVLVGSKQILARMIHNNYTAKRYTLLKDFIKDEFTSD